MAWRDSRRNRSRLLLFISSIVIGIAALVAINSFSENLQRDINSEAKTLLGADLIVQGDEPAGDSTMQLLDSIGYTAKAHTISLVSMAYFPKNGGGTKLSQIRASEGDFPFYGKLSTEPEAAGRSFRSGQKALVEKTLMMQFGLQPGDTVRIGTVPFVIEGQLNSAPGRAGIAGSIAPVVYIPLEYLEKTGLVQPGSFLFYQHFYKFPEGFKVEELVKNTLDERLEGSDMHTETVEERKRQMTEAFGNLATFLNLVGFIALLLGCIGVASSVHIYIKDKMASIAVLRCLGMKGGQAFRIYLYQVIALGLGGGLLGALIGSALQVALPAVLGDFLPLQKVSTEVSWVSIAAGVFTGLAITILFALLPLLSIRRVSPLRTLRASYEEDTSKKDPLRWVVYGLIFGFICGFTFVQTRDWKSLFFPVGVTVAFLALAGVAKALTWAVRRFFPKKSSYIWRQSIANLYRPNNQTLILIVTVGLGTALISTLFLVQDLLLKQVAYAGTGNVPNLIAFDIQAPQKEAVAQLTRDQGLPVKQLVPIVTMRIESIDGMTQPMFEKDTILNPPRKPGEERRRRRGDDDDGGPPREERRGRRGWVYEREYRCTYRDSLIDTEEITEGEWHGKVASDGTIYISIQEGVAKDMDVKIGSKVTFNVQGALVETVVGSFRKVDFNRVQTNFFIVFPDGVLEQAPQFFVVISRVEDEAQSARYQQALVKNFPNVSVVDLTQILKSVKSVLDKVSFVIRFMALFSILTGLVVLISSVVLSKYQRIQESVLLRTLGAHRRQILWINALEYFMLGSLATLTGICLSIVGSYALAKFTLNIPYQPNLLPALIVFVVITGLTVLIGMLNSREVVNKPPLEVLRKEV